MEDAVKMLNLILQQLSRSFICIDALDELEPANRRQLLENLKSVPRIGITRVFLTGRPHIQDEVNTYFHTEESLEIQLIANLGDIREYINHKLRRTQDLRKKQ